VKMILRILFVFVFTLSPIYQAKKAWSYEDLPTQPDNKAQKSITSADTQESRPHQNYPDAIPRVCNLDSDLIPVIPTVIPGPNAIIGGELTCNAQKGETVQLLGAKLGINWQKLAEYNKMSANKPISQPDQRLYYNNRRIIPMFINDGLVINIPERTLYFFKDGVLSEMSAITVGKSDPKWQTTTGSFTITEKIKNPTWTVPPSIQEEMMEKGEEVLTEVPPGKKNPLGKYALRTSIPGIMIHGTNIPTSIFGFRSHGCIRVYPDNMEKLFRAVSLETYGRIIYMPVKIAKSVDGRIFLEVHPDIYFRIGNLKKNVRKLADHYDLSNQIDWGKVDLLVKKRNGVAEDITAPKR
jgi:L,D-transpeptidase ErfK/SrfK